MAQMFAWIASGAWCMLLLVGIAYSKVNGTRKENFLYFLGWLSLAVFMFTAFMVLTSWEHGNNILLQIALTAIMSMSTVGYFIATSHYMIRVKDVQP